LDFAWPAFSVLVLLIPGFTFFAGLYSGEKFGRDNSSPDLVSKFAVIVLVSLGVHTLLFFLIHRLHWATIPEPDGLLVLSTLRLSASKSGAVRSLAPPIFDGLGWIFLYFASSAVLGFLAGKAAYRRVTVGKFQFLVENPWVYNIFPSRGAIRPPTPADTRALKKAFLWIGHVFSSSLRLFKKPEEANVAFAYILSKLPATGPAESRPMTVLYRGLPKLLGFGRDGRLSYLILSSPEKCSLRKDASGVVIAPPEWTKLGALSENVPGGAKSPAERRLYVDMAEIANVVFDPWEEELVFDETPMGAVDILTAGLRDRKSETHPSKGKLGEV
jgi:hypothetical protein